MPSSSTLLDLLGPLLAGEDPPTPAMVRAAVREHAPTHDDLALLLKDLRMLGATVRVVEDTIGRTARTFGIPDEDVADALRLSVHTLKRRVPRARVRVRPVEADAKELWRASAAPDEQAQLWLRLDLDQGTLEVTDEDTETSMVYRWPLPPLTPKGANSLMQALVPHALQVMLGTDVREGEAELDAGAKEAEREIAAVCAAASSTYPCLRTTHASDHFGDHSPLAVATALGLHATASHDQIMEAADLAERTARSMLVRLHGTRPYLEDAVARMSATPALTGPVPEPEYESEVMLPAALAPHLEAMIDLIRPVIDNYPCPLGTGRAYHACRQLIDAVDSSDTPALIKSARSLLELNDGDAYDFITIPGLRPAWNALREEHKD